MKRFRQKVLGISLTMALVLQFLPAGYGIPEVKAVEDTPGESVVTVAAPTFSKESGNYADAFDLTLSAAAGTAIYYSTDGSIPSPERMAEGNANVFSYSGAIKVKDRTGEKNVLATPENIRKMDQEKDYVATDEQVAKSTVIRAMAVDADGNKSPVATKTYFIGSNLTTRYQDVAVISLVTDPKNLMDDETGIFVVGNHENYLQHGREWERDAYVDFYDVDGKIDFATNVGIRARGGYTRKYQQKSLNVYFREEYGLKNLKYELIPGATNFEGTKATGKYKNFMLRNGGNDCFLTKTRDVFIQSLVTDRNMAVQSYRPCVVYLNGEYWGLYNLQEKYGDNWLEEEFGVNKDNVVLIKDGEVDEGTEADIALFDELRNLAKLDMTKAENYKKFTDAVELQSYLDYYATEVLIGNRDWGLTKNNQFWRSRTKTNTKYEDGKWRWLLHDTEFSMNLYNMSSGDTIKKMAEEGEDGNTNDPLFLALLKNTQFRQAFVNTAMDLLNENFNYTKHSAKYVELKDFYEKLMVEQCLRYGTDWQQNDLTCFNNSTNGFIDAWSTMQSRVEKLLKDNCSVANTTTISVSANIDKADTIKVNTLSAGGKGSAWTGKYFREAPVRVIAPEVEGYEFSNWEITGGTAANPQEADTQVTLSLRTASIKAVYKEKSDVPPTPTVKPDVTQKPVTPTVKPDATQKPGSTPTAKPVQTKKPQTTDVVKAPKRAVIKKVSSPKRKTIKVKIKKQSADGFEIVYARNKKCTKSRKKTNTTKYTKTIKKLKRKKTYYVKVRAYRKKKGGGKVFGKFSKVKRIKVK